MDGEYNQLATTKFDVKTVVQGQAMLDEYLDSFDSFIQLDGARIANVSGSELARYARSNHDTGVFESTSSEGSLSSHSMYEHYFGVDWNFVDTLHIRCIDERRTDFRERSSIVSFATAGCGCFCESSSEDRSIDHTTTEFLSVIRLWQNNNPTKESLRIEIEPHERCGAMKLALKSRYPHIKISTRDVDAAAESYAHKLKLKLKSVLYNLQDFAHLTIEVEALPLARVFPKVGHPATCAVVSRLDIDGVYAQRSATSFAKFDTLLGLPHSPLSAFAITGEDTAEDLHNLVNRVILAPVIATGRHGLSKFGDDYEFSAHSHTFKIYVEYNGITDTPYLRRVVSGLTKKLAQKKLSEKVEIIAIDRIS